VWSKKGCNGRTSVDSTKLLQTMPPATLTRKSGVEIKPVNVEL